MLTIEGCFETALIVSGVTKPYTVANFGNALAMTIFFFLKIFET